MRSVLCLLFLLVRFGASLEQVLDGQYARYRLNVEPNRTVSARLIPLACPGRKEASDVDLFIVSCDTEAREISTRYLSYSYLPGEDIIVYTRRVDESTEVCAAVFPPPGPFNISCYNLLVERVAGDSQSAEQTFEHGCDADAEGCAGTGAVAGGAQSGEKESPLDVVQTALGVGQFVLRIALVILNVLC
jgi:hypothetical protein